VAETTVKTLLCCGFQRTGKAIGHVYQRWRGICREINVFVQVQISYVLRFISICYLFSDSPSYQVDSLEFRCNFVPLTDFSLLFLYVLSRLFSGGLGLRPLQNHSSLNTPPSTLIIIQGKWLILF
jgi:hypothetical protein